MRQIGLVMAGALVTACAAMGTVTEKQKMQAMSRARVEERQQQKAAARAEQHADEDDVLAAWETIVDEALEENTALAWDQLCVAKLTLHAKAQEAEPEVDAHTGKPVPWQGAATYARVATWMGKVGDQRAPGVPCMLVSKVEEQTAMQKELDAWLTLVKHIVATDPHGYQCCTLLQAMVYRTQNTPWANQLAAMQAPLIERMKQLPYNYDMCLLSFVNR